MKTPQQIIIERHSRSFSLAARLLPPKVAADVHNLYAWCRSCDNAVDEAGHKSLAKLKIDQFRQDIERIYQGQVPLQPESVWLAEIVHKYELPKHWPLDLLEGMESDIDFQPKRNLADLERYCYQAAGVVGLMMARVLGVKNRGALSYAKSLGMAMQMTNIARDVAEDQRRDRCYLPTEWLPEQQAGNGDSTETLTDDVIRTGLKKLLDLAEHHYRLGAQGYPFLPGNVRLSIRVAAMVYRQIGRVIEDADLRVMGQRHHVSTAMKFRLVGRGMKDELVYRVSQSFCKHHYNERSTMKPDTMYLATFGLFLTFVMATVMFALVGINPKLETYDRLPWIYSVSSAIAAGGFWFLSRVLDKKCRNPKPVKQD
jgi:phytoene synthase